MNAAFLSLVLNCVQISPRANLQAEMHCVSTVLVFDSLIYSVLLARDSGKVAHLCDVIKAGHLVLPESRVLFWCNRRVHTWITCKLDYCTTLLRVLFYNPVSDLK